MILSFTRKNVGDFDLNLGHEALLEDRWLFLRFGVDGDQYGKSVFIVGFVGGCEHIGTMFEADDSNDMKFDGDEGIHSWFYLSQTLYYPFIILTAIDL